MKRYCLALDLKNDPALISEYEQLHQKIWPEIEKSMHDAGVMDVQIYRTGDRMCMIFETDDSFSFERKAALDAANATVQKWETLMWKFQQPLPGSKPGEKWLVMDKIYQLKKS